MAYFPLINGTASGTTSTTTLHTVTMPAGIVAGETLTVFFGCDSAVTVNTPSGWTKTLDDTNDDKRMVIYTKTATGSDTLSVTTSVSTSAANVTYRIQVNQSFELAVSKSTGNSFNADPPSLTPTGGSQKYTWIAVCVGRNGQVPTTWPTGYTDNRLSAGRVSVATRDLEASTEDPTAFVLGAGTAEEWICATIAFEERVGTDASFTTISSVGTVFSLAIDYAADATFALISSVSSVFTPTTRADTKTNWTNETKTETTWTNENL